MARVLPPKLKKRVKLALEILGGDKKHIAEVEDAVLRIEGMKAQLRLLGHPNAFYKPEHKKEKVAAEQLRRAVERVDDLLKQRSLHKLIAQTFSDDEMAQWRRQLQQLLARTEVFSKWPLGKPKRATQIDKRLAATEAAALLDLHGVPLNVTRGRGFCHLAAVLNGDATADLYEHCRAVKRDRT